MLRCWCAGSGAVGCEYGIRSTGSEDSVQTACLLDRGAYICLCWRGVVGRMRALQVGAKEGGARCWG